MSRGRVQRRRGWRQSSGVPLTTRLWVPAPVGLLARVLGLVDAADPDLREAVGALASLPGLPVLPLDSLEEPGAAAASVGHGRVGVRQGGDEEAAFTVLLVVEWVIG
jgi:hypothetical protein